MMEKSEDRAMAVGCPSETDLAGKADICQGCPGQAMCSQQDIYDAAVHGAYMMDLTLASLSEKTLFPYSNPYMLSAKRGGRGPDADQEMIDLRMNAIKHKILVVSGKGGVGKSSVAATISMALAQLNKKVGLVDVDVCGPSVPHLMAVTDQQVLSSEYGWTPLKSPSLWCQSDVGWIIAGSRRHVIWRGPRKTGLIKRFLKDTFWGRLDFLVFDTPPGTSDEHLTVVKALKNVKPDGAVIVTTPQELSLATIRKEINFCRKMGVNVLGIVENMSGFVCPCCNEYTDLFSSGGGESLAKEFGLEFLGRIPLDPNLVTCCEKGMNILEEYPNSPATESLVKLTKTLLTLLE